MKKTIRLLGICAVVLSLAFTACGGDDGGDQPGGGGKQAGATVATPSLVSKTSNSVTVSADAPSNGQTVEYARNNANSAPSSDWQDSGTFSGLNAETEYFFFARSKTNTTHNTGSASTGLSVTTNAVGSPSITTTTLPNGAVNTVYNQTLTATGDTPITWTHDSGTLPDGLSISNAGIIEGTPTTANTFTFTVKATNAKGNDTKSLSIIIDPPFNEDDGAANIGRTGPGGGIIFYYNDSGFTVEMVNTAENYTAHYLEVAPTITGTDIQWEDLNHVTSGVTTFTSSSDADAAKIGNGRKDTALIIAYLENRQVTGKAAQLCASLTTGGKTDWFLPSVGELKELYKQRNLTGINITSGDYWSSSQRSSPIGGAWLQNFDDGWGGYQISASKTYEKSVRAIRAF